ncbi:MAG: phosphatase PAP2 family protein [Desulfobacterales bacterium]|nr:phosphatase PAP2 family protein [Desulfobacterales bacterium]
MKSTPFKQSLILSVLLVLVCIGCASKQNTPKLNSTLTPGWDTIKTSFTSAVKDPHTWLPLLGASIFLIEDYDEQVSSWAVKHTPIFGSAYDALDYSDKLKNLSRTNYFVTVIALPADTIQIGIYDKSINLAFGLSAFSINSNITSSLKKISDRNRPNNSNNLSFPSAHASSSTISARLSSRNIEKVTISKTAKRVWQFSSMSIAGLTSWARVEGGIHYPSDVLAGYALGNFIGAFLNDAFIAPDYQHRIHIDTYINTSQEIYFSITFQFQ